MSGVDAKGYCLDLLRCYVSDANLAPSLILQLLTLLTQSQLRLTCRVQVSNRVFTHGAKFFLNPIQIVKDKDVLLPQMTLETLESII